MKQALWEISTNLVVFGENLSAMNFPARQVLNQIQSMQDALDSINPLVVENDQPVPFETPEKLEEIVRGFKISYRSRHNQLYLDGEVRGQMHTA